eukprot:14776778-Alexandrium_andersonii.AAC.1
MTVSCSRVQVMTHGSTVSVRGMTACATTTPRGDAYGMKGATLSWPLSVCTTTCVPRSSHSHTPPWGRRKASRPTCRPTC